VEVVISLVYTPQRADFRADYAVNSDVLTVTIEEITETFDFTGLEEGVAEEIITETLPINPIAKAEKIGETVNVTVIKFYDFEEKPLFEAGAKNG
jgi:ribosomal protein S1